MLLLQFVKIQPEFLNGLLTVSERLRPRPCSAIPHVFSFQGQRTHRGKNSSGLVEPAGNHSLSNRCALLQLWAHCVDGLLTATVPETKNENRLLQRIRELVGQMPEIELFRYSSADLASQLYCSERHFSRLFRQEFGVPFRTHQIALRLEHACQLLKDPGKKILNIANESGYQNTGLFNAMFKRRFGVTPTEWRRRNSIPPFRQPRSESENIAHARRKFRRARAKRQIRQTRRPGAGSPPGGISRQPLKSVSGFFPNRHLFVTTPAYAGFLDRMPA